MCVQIKFPSLTNCCDIISVGEGIMCAINRSSIFILLLIQLHLCDLTRSLYCMIHNVKQSDTLFKIVAAALPLLLVTIAYAIENNDVDSKNYELNVARHAFSCTMRFQDMLTEWGLLWTHFIWSGVLTIFFCAASWRTIGAVAQGAGTNVASATRNRLLRISFMICACLLMNTAATVLVSMTLGDWSTSANIWLTCSVSEEYLSRSWSSYGLYQGGVINFNLACVICPLSMILICFLSNLDWLIDDPATEICSRENTKSILAPCTSSCYWDPGASLEDENDLFMLCAIHDNEYDPLQSSHEQDRSKKQLYSFNHDDEH